MTDREYRTMRFRYLVFIPVLYCVGSALWSQWKAESCAWSPVPVEQAVIVAENEFKRNMRLYGYSDEQVNSFSCRNSCRTKITTGVNVWRYIMNDVPNEFAILVKWGDTDSEPQIHETMYVSSCGRFIDIGGVNEWYD
jgi:hypothetical protein